MRLYGVVGDEPAIEEAIRQRLDQGMATDIAREQALAAQRIAARAEAARQREEARRRAADQESCAELRGAPRNGDDPGHRGLGLRNCLHELVRFGRTGRLPSEAERCKAREMLQSWDDPAARNKVRLAVKFLCPDRGLGLESVYQLLREPRRDLRKRLERAGIILSPRHLNRALRLVWALAAITM